VGSRAGDLFLRNVGWLSTVKRRYIPEDINLKFFGGFYDVVRRLYGRIVRILMNNESKGFGRKRGLIDAEFRHFSGGREKTHEEPQSGYHCTGRDSNPESAEYRSAALPLQQICSVETVFQTHDNKLWKQLIAHFLLKRHQQKTSCPEIFLFLRVYILQR
jgi:hypothetical protein